MMNISFGGLSQVVAYTQLLPITELKEKPRITLEVYFISNTSVKIITSDNIEKIKVMI